MRQENNLHNHRIPIYVLITLENGLVRRLPRFIAMSIFFFLFTTDVYGTTLLYYSGNTVVRMPPFRWI